ncbi:MaoC family dehydratase [Hypericibacter sp.]|uniref:MaoC family dehydratase n=1 Tax=Hypericibacter sp. TaxID=2705401 RepID=UPI003D6CFC74
MIEGLVTYERLMPGAKIGSLSLDIAAADIDDYRRITAGTDLELPLSPGLAVALMMRAYMRLMPERPPGSIHASQKLRLGVPLAAGDRVTVALRCAEKERRKERGWVRFETEIRNQASALVLASEHWVVWGQ